MHAFSHIILAAFLASTIAARSINPGSSLALLRRNEESFRTCIDACNDAVSDDPNAPNADEEFQQWMQCNDDCIDDELGGSCDAGDLGDKDNLNECLEDCADENAGDKDAIEKCSQECLDDFCDSDIFD